MVIQKAFINFRIWLSFLIWRKLAGGRLPFYSSLKLRNHKTYIAPVTKSRLRLWLWCAAQSYLVNQGQLTMTPTLREKF